MDVLSGKKRTNQTSAAVIVLSLVVSVMMMSFALPVYAQVGSTTSMSAADLGCVEENQSDVSERLDDLATQTTSSLPAAVQNQIAGERVIITVGENTHFSAIVDEQAKVQDVRVGEIENPTLRAETDCQTIQRIANSDSPESELQRAISQGKIDWRGTTAQADAAANYGSRSVQTAQVVSEGETGNAQDAADGFSSGVTFG